MNIKSMLLGTAAALVAVSGARAADAVVMVEPEPVDYVRVCDVYGTGFFYIPGTETCLQISGALRFRIYASDESFQNTGFDLDDDDLDDDYAASMAVRARVNFDAREETELGTLRAFIQLESGDNLSGPGSLETSDASTDMNAGFIQLGGLTMGYLDSLWANDDGGISDGLFTDNDWSVGDRQANRISYTYAANGFSGTVSVEDDGDGDFTPDVLAKLAYTGGFGGAYIMGVYDEDASDSFFDNEIPVFNPITGEFDSIDGTNFIFTDENDDDSDGAFALKAGVMLENLIAEDSAFKIEGHYAFDPTIYASNEYLAFTATATAASLTA